MRVRAGRTSASFSRNVSVNIGSPVVISYQGIEGASLDLEEASHEQNNEAGE